MLMRRSVIAKTCLFTSQVLRDFVSHLISTFNGPPTSDDWEVADPLQTLKSDTTFGIFQLIKTWIDDWSSIVVLREVALSIDNLEMRRMPAEMRVMIPSQNAETQPLEITTAVPIQTHGLLPAFGHENMVVQTPRPFADPQAISI